MPSPSNLQIFFNFSEEVSSLLTELVTYQDQIPQGSPVSSDIANIVLCWDGRENQLVNDLASNNLRYSRYVDDIAISSLNSLTNEEKTAAIRAVISFANRKGFRIRHRKTELAGPKKVKCVTGVRLGNNSNKLPHGYIDSVYHQIRQLEFQQDSFDKRISSIVGKINYIKQFSPKQAARLEEALRLK